MRVVLSLECLEAYLAEYFNGIENFCITKEGVEFDATDNNSCTPRDQYVAEINELKKALISMSGSIQFAHEVIAGAIQGYAIEEEDGDEAEEESDER
jgi:hypothetical protein